LPPMDFRMALAADREQVARVLLKHLGRMPHSERRNYRAWYSAPANRGPFLVRNATTGNTHPEKHRPGLVATGRRKVCRSITSLLQRVIRREIAAYQEEPPQTGRQPDPNSRPVAAVARKTPPEASGFRAALRALPWPRPGRDEARNPGTNAARAAFPTRMQHLNISPASIRDTRPPPPIPGASLSAQPSRRNEARTQRVPPQDAGVSTPRILPERGATLGPRSEPTGAFLPTRNAERL
jgi:hypothetical protein